MDPLEVALAYVEAINAHDVDRIVALMEEGSLIISARGGGAQHDSASWVGWETLFNFDPEYKITIEEAFHSGEKVALFGKLSGLYLYAADQARLPEHRYSMTAAYRVIVRGDKVTFWQEYHDSYAWSKVMAHARRQYLANAQKGSSPQL